MQIQFHRLEGRLEIEDMTPEGIHEAKYQCTRMLEELEDAERALDPDDDEA